MKGLTTRCSSPRIPTNMKIHYFLKDNTNDNWHDVELIAWLEKESPDCDHPESSFKMIEDIRLHASKGDHFHNVSFKTDFGKDTSIGSFSKNSRELIERQTNNATMYSSASKLVSRDEYELCRAEIFEIYQKEMFLDLDKIEEK